MFYLKISVGDSDLYFMVQWFALDHESNLMYDHGCLGL